MLGMAVGCCVTLGKCLDLSGPQAPSVQVRAMDGRFLLACGSQQVGQPRSALRPGSVPPGRFCSLPPRVAVISPPPISALHPEASGLQV